LSHRCGCGWEALRGDPLAWLLDEHQPNLRWRVLTELVGRPQESPAVRRAQGGASACEPVASLIADLHPDGTWATATPTWQRYGGPGWRLIAAVQWGADPSDPRLDAAAAKILDHTPGDGGFAVHKGGPVSAILTARLVQAAAGLGYARHLRVQEALAWFEEDPLAWAGPVSSRRAAAAALLAALTRSRIRRRKLEDLVIRELVGGLRCSRRWADRFGHPNLARTDSAEVLWALARAGVPWEQSLARPLRHLQQAQLAGGRWPVRHSVPRSLGLKPMSSSAVGEMSRWISLRAVVAMNAYAVAAGLPRLFPEKP